MTDSLKTLLRSLWESKSERDQQRLVGASNISNECTRCLAGDMALALPGVEVGSAPQSEYMMGAKIGTAIHEYLENEIKKYDWGVPETKVILGEIEGYGVIKSTSDVYVPSLFAIVDHKTTTIKKLDIIRTLVQLKRLDEVPEFEPDTHTLARKKVKRYLVQGNLYGLGAENRGDKVETVALNFIPRDSKKIDDQWVYQVDYDRGVAERAFDRAARIWKALEGGEELSTFKSDPHCYTCSVLRKAE